MKNLHLLPTDKPSRLYSDKGKLWLDDLVYGDNNQHIYITSDEEIKAKDYYIHNNNVRQSAGGEQQRGDYKNCKKIILTTDQDLIKDGVQSIDDEFIEWFIKNPSCNEVETEIVEFGFDEVPICTYKIIIPSEEPKQETLEEAFLKYENNRYHLPIKDSKPDIESAKFGAKWQQEQHDFLPGFIKQYDPKEGEIEGWTAVEFLRWLDLNKFKIVK